MASCWIGGGRRFSVAIDAFKKATVIADRLIAVS